MRQIIKDDILAVLKDVIAALKEGDFITIGKLSNHIIHDASIFQEEDPLSLAVLVYALSKLIHRCVERQHEHPSVLQQLEKAHQVLEQNKYDEYRGLVKNILREISQCDSRLKLYIREVIEQAKIKKASKLHEHGISIARTAELLGVDQWELQNYIGKTVTEIPPNGITVQDRLRKARSLFR